MCSTSVSLTILGTFLPGRIMPSNITPQIGGKKRSLIFAHTVTGFFLDKRIHPASYLVTKRSRPTYN